MRHDSCRTWLLGVCALVALATPSNPAAAALAQEEAASDVVARERAGQLGRLEFLDLKTGGVPLPPVGATEVAR